MVNMDLARHRTKSPSPSRMFATSITPIVIDSSPLVPFASSTVNVDFAESTKCNYSGLNERQRHDKLKEVASRRTCLLTSSPGRENLPMQRPQSQKNDKEDGIFTSDIGIRENSAFDGLMTRVKDNPSTTAGSKKSKAAAGGTRRAKKGDVLVNGTITGRATKASVTKSLKSTSKASAEQSLRRSEEIPLSFKEPRSIGAEWEIDMLHLEAATKRRNDWTPVKDTVISTLDLTADSDTSPASTMGTGGQRFTSLLSDYAFTKGQTSITDTEYRGQAPTKKRRLEFYQGNATSASIDASSNESVDNRRSQQSGTKRKPTRKATATTITSLSTAQYGQRAASPSSSLMEFFSPAKTTTAKAVGKATSKRTRTKKDGTGKTKEVAAPRVVPAVDALKSLEDQVYLFGTSSQLERISSDEELEVNKSNPETHTTRLHGAESGPGSILSRYQPSRNLWSAGCRNLDGSVADIEVVDMTNSPTTFNRQAGSQLVANARNPEPGVANCQALEDAPDNKPAPMAQQNQHISVEPEAATSVEKMPNFRGFTTAELTQKVAAFGFKTIKSREKMISLLENCWESQSKVPVSISVPANNSKSRPSGKQKNGGRNKSQKQSVDEASLMIRTRATSVSSLNKIDAEARDIGCSQQTSYEGNMRPLTTQFSSQSIIVIPDSDDDADGDFLAAPALITEMSTVSSLENSTNFALPETPLPTRSRTEIRVEVGTPDIKQQITKAVRAQPRMTAINGVKRPTWLEKILMYDPIRLDDLTVWLNTEGLNSIEEDREVNRLTVREWCEGKGICCTWTK